MQSRRPTAGLKTGSSGDGGVRPEGNMTVQLKSSSWLRRTIEVRFETANYVVEYSGWGFAYETVRVNGKTAARPRSWCWFVSYIEFPIGDAQAAVEISVWPWLAIRLFKLTVNGEPVYEEARRLQFSLRAILIVVALSAAVFAIARWLHAVL